MENEILGEQPGLCAWGVDKVTQQQTPAPLPSNWAGDVPVAGVLWVLECFQITLGLGVCPQLGGSLRHLQAQINSGLLGKAHSEILSFSETAALFCLLLRWDELNPSSAQPEEKEFCELPVPPANAREGEGHAKIPWGHLRHSKGFRKAL